MNASLRLSLSSLRAHKRRFAGTFLAVFLGVAFLSGTLVMGDTLRASFDTMFAGATSGTDAVVRSADAITTPGESQGVREPVDAGLAEAVARVPGVAAAAPSIQGAGQLIGADGEPVGGQGPPTLAGNWIADPELNPYRLAEGRAPRASGEVVVNRGTAERGGLRIGDTTVLRTPDPVEVTVVGLATFGGADGMAQVTYTGMTRADAEKHLTARPGEAASIQVRAGPGVGQRELVDRLAAVLPEGVEAITGQEAAEENTEMISSQFLTLFTTFLLVFSGVALLVATFSIHNTFAIVVAQRTRRTRCCAPSAPPAARSPPPRSPRRPPWPSSRRPPDWRAASASRPACGPCSRRSASRSRTAPWSSACRPCSCRSPSASWSASAPPWRPPCAPAAPRRWPPCGRRPSTPPAPPGHAPSPARPCSPSPSR